MLRRAGLLPLHKEPVFIQGRLLLPAQQAPHSGVGQPRPGALAFFLGLASFSNLFFNFFPVGNQVPNSRFQQPTRVHTSRILTATPACPPSTLPACHPLEGCSSFLVSSQSIWGTYKHTCTYRNIFFLLPFSYTGLQLFVCWFVLLW